MFLILDIGGGQLHLRNSNQGLMVTTRTYITGLQTVQLVVKTYIINKSVSLLIPIAKVNADAVSYRRQFCQGLWSHHQGIMKRGVSFSEVRFFKEK